MGKVSILDLNTGCSSWLLCCISYALGLLGFPAWQHGGSSPTLQYFRYSQKSSLIILGIAAVSLTIFLYGLTYFENARIQILMKISLSQMTLNDQLLHMK